MKNRLLKIYVVIQTFLFALQCNASGSNPIMDSEPVKGTQALLSDVTTVLLWLAPSIGTLTIIYCAIRLNGADEVDQKKWKSGIKVAILSMVGVVVASAITKVVLSYFI